MSLEPRWLKDFSEEELKGELERREKVRNQRPRPQGSDFSPLVEWMESGMDHVEQHNCEPKDFEHYVFETAMNCVYGKDVWEWLNRKLSWEE